MSCLLIIGVLSSNIISAEAAICKHPVLRVTDNVFKEEYHDAYYHYIIYGTEYYCPCGYTYWENLSKTRKEHTWATKNEIIDGKNAEIIYCRECNYVP